MNNISNNLAVMFIDICGSTKLFEKVGDQYALLLTTNCLSRMNALISKQDGIVHESRGDGLLCSFASVEIALQTAQSIREALQSDPLSVHAGLHYGHTIVSDDNIYGDTVNVAARLVDFAKDDEIILSEDAFEQLPISGRQHILALGQVRVKGKDQLIRIYLSAYQGLDPTLIRGTFMSAIGGSIKLNLIYRNRTYQLKSSAAFIVLGRYETCDLIVQHDYVSRRHATIECKRGKFFIQDHSSNGTYINDQTQQCFFLRRDMMQLRDNGLISLGIEPHKQLDHIIKYHLMD